MILATHVYRRFPAFSFLLCLIIGLTLFPACMSDDDRTPVGPDRVVETASTKQAFDLFGPVDLYCFCDDDTPDRESAASGEKILPMRERSWDIGESVPLLDGGFTMYLANPNAGGDAPRVAQLRITIDDVLVADQSALTADLVTVPVAGLTGSSVLRIEYAGECDSGIGVRIEGALAAETVVIEAGGGTVSVDDPGGPLDGTTLVVPAGAVAGTTLFLIQEADDPPPNDPAFVPLGSIADVQSTQESDFGEPLQLSFTLPAAFPSDDIPCGVYYDEESASWMPALSSLSADEQTISVETDHLSVWAQTGRSNSPVMNAAMAQLTDVTTDLQNLLAELDEVTGQQRCAELATLRFSLATKADTYSAGIPDWDSAILKCAQHYCADQGFDAMSAIEDIEDAISVLALEPTNAHALGLGDIVSIFVDGTSREAVLEIGRILITAFWGQNECALCTLWESPQTQDYASLFGFVMSAVGVELIDEYILENGCTFIPTGEDILVPPLEVAMPATFTMGSIYGGPPWEETQHQVTLTYRCYMGEAEVTNGEYVEALQWAYDQGHVSVTSLSVLGALDGATAELVDMDDSYCQIEFSEGVFTTFYPDYPVRTLTWWGAIAYCDWLNMQDGQSRVYNHSTGECNGGNPYTALGYRLPTEAEWEFACRAGTTTEYSTGDCLDSATEANYYGPYTFGGCPAGPVLGESAIAGSYPPNPWGLYSMHGNMREWCNDWVGPYEGDEVNPTGSDVAGYRSLRGGNWLGTAEDCRSAARGGSLPWAATNMFTGFRIAKTAY